MMCDDHGPRRELRYRSKLDARVCVVIHGLIVDRLLPVVEAGARRRTVLVPEIVLVVAAGVGQPMGHGRDRHDRPRSDCEYRRESTIAGRIHHSRKSIVPAGGGKHGRPNLRPSPPGFERIGRDGQLACTAQLDVCALHRLLYVRVSREADVWIRGLARRSSALNYRRTHDYGDAECARSARRSAMTERHVDTGFDSASAAALRSSIEGEVVTTADSGYAAACALWNGMVARKPAAVVRAGNTKDVVTALGFAREHRLPLSVRGGGHNVAGTALCDDGIAIDLSGMRQVTVDPQRRTARAQGGATLGDLDRATQQHHLAAPVGVVSRTGVAGLTLHGGLGFLTRKHGLACDNLIAAEVVTADGRVVQTSESENADLLWALRGGGGNFGVVTALEFRLHPIGPEIFLCLVMYPAADAPAVMRYFREFMASAPDEVMALSLLWNSPAGEPIPEPARDQPVVVIAGAFAGPPEQGERVLAPLRTVATPLVDISGTFPYVAAQSLFDEDYPDGRRYYWKSIYLSALDENAIGVLADHARRRPSRISSIDVWALGGAMSKQPPGGSAFSRRNEPFLVGIEANWDDPAQDAANLGWARELYADLERFSRGGVYLNFPGFADERDSDQMLRDAYAGSFDRLRTVKAKYDPDNVFRSNFNISPELSASA
jgi:FAD/FMN-containing dehydrogenase